MSFTVNVRDLFIKFFYISHLKWIQPCFFRETCFPENGLLHLASDFNFLRFIIAHLDILKWKLHF